MSDQETTCNVQEESIPTLESTEEVQQDVLARATSLPLVSSTYDLAASAYASTKENHPYVKAVLDLAEKGVKHVSDIAVTSAQPLLSKLEPQAAVASHYASKSLDELEKKLPILHETAGQVISETQALVASKVVEAKEVVVKAVEGGKELVAETRVCKIALSGAEVILEKSEELLYQYLPMTDEELAKLAESAPEGADTASETQGYFVRLGSLSTKLRHCAYQHAVAKMKMASDCIKEALSRLHRAIGQIEDTRQDVNQKLQEGQEKLHQIESQTLAMSYQITQQLQASYKNLIASIQGLPVSLHQNIQQAYHNMQELHAYFANAHSFKDLSSSILSQSKEKAIKAQKYMDDLLEYVMQNTPLSWLVGPVAPALKSSDTMGPAKPDDGEEGLKDQVSKDQ